MAEPNPAGERPPEPKKNTVEGKDRAAAPAETGSVTGSTGANQLTPEEQMALFEKELKETDWGHQPC